MSLRRKFPFSLQRWIVTSEGICDKHHIEFCCILRHGNPQCLYSSVYFRITDNILLYCTLGNSMLKSPVYGWHFFLSRIGCKLENLGISALWTCQFSVPLALVSATYGWSDQIIAIKLVNSSVLSLLSILPSCQQQFHVTWGCASVLLLRFSSGCPGRWYSFFQFTK